MALETGGIQVIENNDEVIRWCADAPRSLALVPTMGALHAGHLALVRAARRDNRTVVVSIFVNPTQFEDSQDLARYPRDMAHDLEQLRREGVDAVYTPPPTVVYPPGFDTWIEPGDLGNLLEGVHRPGHFRGVATVVAKLFNLVRPDRAYFGQKDGQQTVIIQKLVRDLNLGIDIVVIPTVREADGLALSSRNVYLTGEERLAAPVLYRGLCRAHRLRMEGVMQGDHLRKAVRAALEEEPLVQEIDYVSVADGETLEELSAVSGRAMVSAAIRMGKVRLIDNILLD